MGFFGGPVAKASTSNLQGVWVQSLVGELRSHMPWGQKNQNIKQKQYCNKFNKEVLKMVHIKEKTLIRVSISLTFYRVHSRN